MESQLKIIDFNHSRMFNLDDSPFRVRYSSRFMESKVKLSDEQMWQQVCELPSPMLPVRTDKEPEKLELGMIKRIGTHRSENDIGMAATTTSD